MGEVREPTEYFFFDLNFCDGRWCLGVFPELPVDRKRAFTETTFFEISDIF